MKQEGDTPVVGKQHLLFVGQKASMKVGYFLVYFPELPYYGITICDERQITTQRKPTVLSAK